MDGLLDRRAQLAQGLLSNPEMPQMGPEIGWLEQYLANVGQRVNNLGGMLDPMNWYQAIGSMPRPGTPEARGALGSYDDLYNLVTSVMPIGMMVHHGSPNKWMPEPGFPAGRPRLDKIGTGEGAQAYGHGMYFAESPEVAKAYQTAGMTFAPTANGSMVQPVFRGKTISELTDPDAKSALEAFSGAMFYGDLDPVKTAKLLDEGGFAKDAAWIRANAKEIGTEPISRLYSLDLPDEQLPNLLDWDKPLSQQPEAVRKALTDNYIANWLGDLDAQTGEELIARMYRSTGNDGSVIAKELAEAGIPGLSYLDASSRGAGEGTRNFVVWDQDLLDEMGRRMAKAQGLLPEKIPDELPSWAPAARMAQWRTARENAALPVEQGGLGLGPANTAAERAAAGGYVRDLTHGTGGPDFEAFDITKHRRNYMGKGIHGAEDPWLSSRYGEQWREGQRVMPLKSRATNLATEQDYQKADFDVRGEVEEMWAGGKPVKFTNEEDEIRRRLMAQGFEGVRYQHPPEMTRPGGSRTTDVIFDPAAIRSRFAAFDPMRRNEADLLASWLLPTLFGGGLLGAGLYNQPQAD